MESLAQTKQGNSLVNIPLNVEMFFFFLSPINENVIIDNVWSRMKKKKKTIQFKWGIALNYAPYWLNGARAKLQAQEVLLWRKAVHLGAREEKFPAPHPYSRFGTTIGNTNPSHSSQSKHRFSKWKRNIKRNPVNWWSRFLNLFCGWLGKDQGRFWAEDATASGPQFLFIFEGP